MALARGPIRLLALVAAFGAAGCASLQTGSTADLLIEDVTIIDVVRGVRVPGRDVLVRGETIAAVTPAGHGPLPSGAKRVDGRGRFLMPGLWDMHTHLEAAGQESLPLFLANGIVGVRDMGSDTGFVLELRRQTASGATLGPRIVASGAMLDDAPADWPFRRRVGNPAEAQAAVESLDTAGADFVKVHGRLSRESYFAIVAAARAAGLSFAGHLPESVSSAEAAEAGQASIEHLGEYKLLFECAGRADVTLETVVEAYDAERCAGLFGLFRTRGIWHTPTLAALRTFSMTPTQIEAELRRSGQLAHATPALLAFWELSERLTPPPPEHIRRQLGPMAALAARIAAEMEGAGVGLLAGCDALVPGFCLHDELAAMVAGGMSPAAALRTATLNPALFLGEADRRGAVEAGRAADLLLLDADPLADIANSRRISALILGGRLLDRQALDRMLAASRRER